ncbi:methionine/alanine import family NSS transporter small subunit [Isoptericola sp. b490]|nr:methionine/alanine import family NSS transporter small subunit [Isoptericola sp. b490]MDO8121971.1 methionine/alanine import family NSS transporter small subunit [Isoptericola sp. b490]
MTPTAITFLVLSVTIIWGGLAASIVLLRRDTRADDNRD